MKYPIAEVVRKIFVAEQRPIVSTPDLESLLLEIYSGAYSDQYAVRTRKEIPSEIDLLKATQRLQESRVVRLDPDFGSSHYQVFDVLEQNTEAVCCTADTHVYVSHLSAMQMHGLTDRSPTDLVITRSVDARPKVYFPERVRERTILLHETRHPGAWEALGPRVRVATCGQTFLDMVVRPGWCGGISHVLEVWEREAEMHLDAIITSVGSYSAKLPKVRAGYILNEVLGVTDERVLAWQSLSQRGSSQKLDPEKSYSPIYSEKWMISLNA